MGRALMITVVVSIAVGLWATTFHTHGRPLFWDLRKSSPVEAVQWPSGQSSFPWMTAENQEIELVSPDGRHVLHKGVKAIVSVRGKKLHKVTLLFQPETVELVVKRAKEQAEANGLDCGVEIGEWGRAAIAGDALHEHASDREFRYPPENLPWAPTRIQIRSAYREGVWRLELSYLLTEEPKPPADH